MNYWTPTNRNADHATMNDPEIWGGYGSGALYGQQWRKSDYLRLKQIYVGYSFKPKFLVNTINVSKVTVYASGNNVFTLTNLVEGDPEQLDMGNFVKGLKSSTMIGFNVLNLTRIGKQEQYAAYIVTPNDSMTDYTINRAWAPVSMQEATDGVTKLLPIPSDYYTISNNSQIVISKGKHTGTVVIRPDSARFLADALTLRANYVLPLYIESADVDTILESKRFTVIGLHYECMSQQLLKASSMTFRV